MRYAKMVAKWSPAGRRMRPEEKLAWRERRLADILAREGIPFRAALREVLVDQMIKEDHRSNHARYVRAYGSGRDASKRKKRSASKRRSGGAVRVKAYKVSSYKRKAPKKHSAKRHTKKGRKR
jgi:hypothetical protein